MIITYRNHCCYNDRKPEQTQIIYKMKTLERQHFVKLIIRLALSETLQLSQIQIRTKDVHIAAQAKRMSAAGLHPKQAHSAGV